MPPAALYFICSSDSKSAACDLINNGLDARLPLNTHDTKAIRIFEYYLNTDTNIRISIMVFVVILSKKRRSTIVIVHLFKGVLPHISNSEYSI